MAIVLPLMLLLMVNVWDLGRAFFISLNLTDAVYQGARLAAHSDRTIGEVQAAVQADAPSLHLTDAAIVVSRPAVAGQAVVITVTYPFVPTPSAFSRWIVGDSITRQASEIVR